jgi:Uma2 family endonuclease
VTIRHLLVVEVADSSLGQDRLTKARIYAAAGIPQYLIMNLRHFPDAQIMVAELLPGT